MQRKLDHEYIKELENMLLEGDLHFRCSECEYVICEDRRDIELEREHEINCCYDCAPRVKRRLAEEQEDEAFITYLYNNR